MQLIRQCNLAHCCYPLLRLLLLLAVIWLNHQEANNQKSCLQLHKTEAMSPGSLWCTAIKPKQSAPVAHGAPADT
jgi:hypothetical protein